MTEETLFEKIKSFPLKNDSENSITQLLALRNMSQEFLDNFDKYTSEECRKLYFGIQMADFHYHRGVEIKFNKLYQSDNGDKK